MSDCCNPSGYRHLFNQREARRSLARYDKAGLDGMARSLVDYLISRGMDGRSVLEAGGGIGALQVELLKAGAETTTNIELSSGYEHVAASLLAREGVADRAKRRIGDFTDLAETLEADDVVMNRVICCYPFMSRLMATATSSSRRFVAATFPRDRLTARIPLAVANAYWRLRGVDFRSFIHPPEEILATVVSAGFQIVFQDRDFIWNAVVWERVR